MNALHQLERAGYEFGLTRDGAIGYTYRGATPPDGSWAGPLLAQIRQQRAEVAAELAARRGQPTGETFTNLTRCRVIFPADTPLPFPAGRWRRLEDGQIEACLNYEELQWMRAIRDEVLP